MGEILHGNVNFDRDGNPLNIGDQVLVVTPSPILRRTEEAALRDLERNGVLKDEYLTKYPLSGNLLRQDEHPPYWIVGLDEPVYYARPGDSKPFVKKLNEIRESSMNLRKISAQTEAPK